MTQATAHFSTISLVIVSVSDQDRAIDFYVGTLGFEKTVDTPFGNGDRWVEVSTPVGATTIALAVPPPGAGTSGGSMTGISLATPDVDAAHAHLREQGADVDDLLAVEPPVPPMFFFRDPDGNTLLAVQERPA